MGIQEALSGPDLLTSLSSVETIRNDTRDVILFACRCASIFERWNQAYAKHPLLLDTIARIQADFTAFRKALSDSVKVAELGLETMIEIKAILRLSQSSSLSEEDLKKIDVDGASQQASEMQTKFFKVRKGVEDTTKVVSPGKVKLDPSDPKAKKLVAKMFRKRTKLFGNHYLLPTWVSLPPPVDLHVFVLDTTRTHENTGANTSTKERYEAAVASLNTLGTFLQQLATCIDKFVVHWISNRRTLNQLQMSIGKLKSSPTSKLYLGVIADLLNPLVEVYSDYSVKIQYLLMLHSQGIY